MKKIVLLIFILSASFGIKAQDITISYSAGYGSFKMNDMNGLLEYIQTLPRPDGNGNALGAAIVDNFPGYVIHTLNIGYKIRKQELGFVTGYQTTGGKLSRIDYSGNYDYKAILNGFRLGFYYRNYFYTFNVDSKRNIAFFGEISPNAVLSSIKVTEKFNIGETPLIDEKNEYTNVSFSIVPQIGTKFNLTSKIGFQATIGYDINIGTEVNKLPTNPKIDWSGLRLAAGAAYTF